MESPAEGPAELAASARAPSRRVRLGVGAAIVIFLVALVGAVLVSGLGSGGLDETLQATGAADQGGEPADGTEPPGTTAEEAPVYVHVWGAVTHAGLYRLHAGARVIDVIAAAGGFSDDADPAGVNLARPLSDGEQLRVPRLGEEPAGEAGGEALGGDAAAGAGAAPGGLVRLNSASLADLETLPRIGPALAQRILDWREANGGFASVDELRSVTGIGARTFEALKAHVTL